MHRLPKDLMQLSLTAALAVGLLTSLLPAADKVDFAQQIRPIFKERCYGCHGPQKQESGLRLDKRQEALAGGDSGAAIVPGDPATGLLLKYVQSEDAEQVMPPKGDRLTEEQIKLLKQWIEDGAEWPEDAEPAKDYPSIRLKRTAESPGGAATEGEVTSQSRTRRKVPLPLRWITISHDP
jgi:mono/diheme cytochrome c family protein